MSLKQTDYAKGIKQMPNASGAEVLAVRCEFPLVAALVVNDIIELGPLPAGHVPVDFIADSDDIDTNGTPTIILQAGILNAGKTDIDTAASGGAGWIGNSTIGQAGGIARATDKAITRMVSDRAADRPFGIKVSTGPATSAVAGVVAGTLLYRSAQYNA